MMGCPKCGMTHLRPYQVDQARFHGLPVVHRAYCCFGCGHSFTTTELLRMELGSMARAADGRRLEDLTVQTLAHFRAQGV